jgi:5-methylcytosine-specific restriction endonuclease McrA
MSRHRSTTTSGKPFAAATIEAVWEKAQVSPQYHPLRFDSSGTLIWKEAYANTGSKFGWEIDHIKPVAEGGGDELENLQPLQWENNRRKGDTFLNGQQTSDNDAAQQDHHRALAMPSS